MENTVLAPDASPLADAGEAIEQATGSLALLEATIRGVLNTGDGLSFAEARGALTLLSSVQTDLGSVTATLQSLASRTPATPATA